MERMTKLIDGKYVVDDHDAAVQLLGRLEDVYEDLVAGQDVIVQQMEQLRNQGKERSVKFRELLGKKMMNNMVIMKIRNAME